MTEQDAARAALARARAAAPSRPTSGAAPATRSGAARGVGRDFVGVDEVVRGLVDDRGWSGPAAVASVIGRWADIVGHDVALHALPEEFDPESGRLTIRTDSTAWSRVLGFETKTLSDRIAVEVGPGVVREIVVLGPVAPTWKHGPRSVRGARGPRDTYG